VLFFSVQGLACGVERIQHLNGVRQELFAHKGKLCAQPTAIEKTGAGELFQLVRVLRAQAGSD
jgi:hypothetical protein